MTFSEGVNTGNFNDTKDKLKQALIATIRDQFSDLDFVDEDIKLELKGEQEDVVTFSIKLSTADAIKLKQEFKDGPFIQGFNEAIQNSGQNDVKLGTVSAPSK